MEYPEIIIKDRVGEQRDFDWLYEHFGEVAITRASPSGGENVIRLIGLYEKEGPAAVVVNVRGLDGEPLEKVAVLRYFPDAPKLPDFGPPTSRWYNKATIGYTNGMGDCGFGMGIGDYYDPSIEQGASAIWCAPPGAACDLVRGLGMIVATNHVHLDPIFQYFPADAYPDPDPDPGPEGRVIQIDLRLSGTITIS